MGNSGGGGGSRDFQQARLCTLGSGSDEYHQSQNDGMGSMGLITCRLNLFELGF